MGEKQDGASRLSFHASLKRSISRRDGSPPDGWLILVRELGERLGFGELITQHPSDSRRLQPPAGL